MEWNSFIGEIGMKVNLGPSHVYHMSPLIRPPSIPTKKTLFDETYKDTK